MHANMETDNRMQSFRNLTRISHPSVMVIAPADAANAFELRVAEPSDAVELSLIASRTFTDTFGHLYPPEHLANYLAEAYPVETMRKELEDPKRYTVLLFAKKCPERPCGYAMIEDGKLRPGDINGDATESLEVKRVYIDKEYHGTGAAYVMMDHIMAVVKQKNRKNVWLGVWENNFKAQKFYHKYNFHEVGEHIFNVGLSKDRDLIYQLQQVTEKDL